MQIIKIQVQHAKSKISSDTRLFRVSVMFSMAQQSQVSQIIVDVGINPDQGLHAALLNPLNRLTIDKF